MPYAIFGSAQREYTRGWRAKMTSDAQRAAIKRMIEQHTRTVTVTQKAAKDSLVKEGVYTRDGKLTEQYGGAKKAG